MSPMLRVAINGFGRIGRSVARIISTRSDIELVAINDVTTAQMMVYLFKNDSVHGGFNGDVELLDDDYLKIGNSKVKLLFKNSPKETDFVKYGTDTVLECSGKFLQSSDVQSHIDNGISQVIFSAVAKDETPTFVLGVNGEEYQGQKIISNASCTTNCLAPIAKIIDDNFGLEKAFVTTIHSYTGDQNLLDSKHSRDLRRSRAAAINMIPTTTGAAVGINKVLPYMNGRISGHSVRVPTPNVSMVDLNVVLQDSATVDEINSLFKNAQNGSLKGILLVDEQMRVSSDFIGSPYSSIVCSDLTQVIKENFIKVMAWYDNEFGYANRLVDMALYIWGRKE